MKAATYSIDKDLNIKKHQLQDFKEEEAQLILAFGEKSLVKNETYFNFIKQQFPNADIAICSTSGEIFQDEASDDSITISALQFDKTPFKSLEIDTNDYKSDYEAGLEMYNQLKADDLKYIMLFSDGSKVHGSDLIRGLNQNDKVIITGGLAGDGENFKDTAVGLNRSAEEKRVVAIGFYGESIKLGQGCWGGWKQFGLPKTITKSKNNELFELDNENIIELYRKYLGKYLENFPASTLLFPLMVKNKKTGEYFVRTVLTNNEKHQSLIFAGDMPEGSVVHLMHSDKNNLIKAAHSAVNEALESSDIKETKYALVVSCVGRKMVLTNRVDEELEEIQEVIGKEVPMGGFYSYGEIMTDRKIKKPLMQNQTLTITLFDES